MPNDDPEKWTPDKPLKDAEDEADCQREAQARARVRYLQDQYIKPDSKPGKKRKGLFHNSD